MKTSQLSAVETIHCLLFRALLEIRSQGQEEKNKVVFHLADLFHTIVLEMKNAAEGRCSYDDVLRLLEERVKEKGLEKWLGHHLADQDRP